MRATFLFQCLSLRGMAKKTGPDRLRLCTKVRRWSQGSQRLFLSSHSSASLLAHINPGAARFLCLCCSGLQIKIQRSLPLIPSLHCSLINIRSYLYQLRIETIFPPIYRSISRTRLELSLFPALHPTCDFPSQEIKSNSLHTYLLLINLYTESTV